MGATGDPVVFNERVRVTTANINTGATLVAVPAGLKFRLVSAKAIPYGGAAGGSTTVDILDGTTKLVAFTLGDGWAQSVPIYDGQPAASSGKYQGAVLADGASYAARTAGNDITIGVTGSALTTCTGIDVIISYTLEI